MQKNNIVTQNTFIKKNLLWFTIVELTVVITIIAVLGTIGFITMTSYFVGARDSVRLSDMSSIYTELGMARGRNGVYPMPEGYRTIALSGTVLAYQGYAGKSTLQTIKFEKWGKDPKDNTYYTYTTNKKQSQAQLLGYFEDYDTSKLSNSTGSSPLLYIATTGAYANRRIGVIGKSICILVETGSLAPVQSTSTGTIDVASTNSAYIVYCDNNNVVQWTGSTLAPTFTGSSTVF